MRPGWSRLLVTLPLCLATGLAGAQAASSTASTNTAAAPAAYVYVSSQPTSGTGHIYGYAASTTGQLTPIPGSPFVSTASELALNGKWLFGASLQSNLITSYSMASNGALKQADSYDSSPYTSPVDLFLDHTGQTLYVGFADGIGDNGYEALNINQTTGKLSLVNATYSEVGNFFALSFIGNNEYAYASDCYHFDSLVYGYARVSGGGLTRLGQTPPIPSAGGENQYCPTGGAAADPYNDVVIPLDFIPSDGGTPTSYSLAVYTANASGQLSTTSTSANMATVKVEPNIVAMSPKGFYLAAAQTDSPNSYGPPLPTDGGIQLFLMHGAKPLTALTGVLLPGVTINEMYWDHYDHLYATSSATGKLYVFYVSTNGTKQVAGSPYSIPSASGLMVLPK